MSLRAYKTKRDLSRSKEPSGKTKDKNEKKPIFVVQKHAARRLHYDLRLEMEGMLKSWAIPKEPTLNPNIKRLAIHVEDHPLEYATFEGTIPKGSYGAGEVSIWDQGTYEAAPEDELLENFKKGTISFTLEGERLKGEFSLVQLKNSKEDQWLLIKKRDAFAKDNEESETEIRAAMPHHIPHMLAMQIDKPFDNKDWIFEIKWDGYRAIAELSSKQTLLYSRNFKSFNKRFPLLINELGRIKKNMIVDGEIVVLNKNGKSDFQRLQNYLKDGSYEGDLRFYVFDLLYYEGRDLRNLPLIERKVILKKHLKGSRYVLYNDHIEEKGLQFFEELKKLNVEGMIAKQRYSAYQSGRCKEWLKIKTRPRQEVVIGGFTAPRGRRKKIGALLVGVYENKQLIFSGHVGGGFNDRSIDDVYEKLQKIMTPKCPFKKIPETNRAEYWVKPKLVCEVEFQEWTQEGLMRQPVFKGLRQDKTPFEVIREVPLDESGALTNLTKIFWPEENYTKGDLINYYKAISKVLLPHLKDRPQVMHRFPDGIQGKDFWQKRCPDFTPDWLETCEVPHSDENINYLLIQDLKSLLYVVNLGSIELHPFTSRIQSLDHPDYIVIDLDPEAISFKMVIRVAQTLHALLEDIQVPHYCKTSGKRGLHICIPLERGCTFEQGEDFAHLLASVLHSKLPKITSIVRDPKKRQKKVYIDFLQNSRTKTIVSVYSVRPTSKATVSTPLSWDEVNDTLDPQAFTIKTVPKRVKNLGDLYKPLLKQKMEMAAALKKLNLSYESQCFASS